MLNLVTRKAIKGKASARRPARMKIKLKITVVYLQTLWTEVIFCCFYIQTQRQEQFNLFYIFSEAPDGHDHFSNLPYLLVKK